MKSIQIEKFGGPEVLILKDTEIGKPGPKEVLIKNLSIGLNFIDVYHTNRSEGVFYDGSIEWE